MNYIQIDILIRLIAAHAITDFILQPKRMVEDKRDKHAKSPFLYLHILITGLFAFLALGELKFSWLLVVLMGTHYVIDIAKTYFKKDNALFFILDQSLHILVLIIIWLLYTDQWHQLKENIIYDYYSVSTTVYATSYLLVTIPSSIFICYLTKKWSKQIKLLDKKKSGLQNAGKWIGMVERILVLTFTITAHFEAIGFLLAAKSIFRFGDLQNGKDRMRTEYILIGTLLSFSISIFLGFTVKFLTQ